MAFYPYYFPNVGPETAKLWEFAVTEGVTGIGDFAYDPKPKMALTQAMIDARWARMQNPLDPKVVRTKMIKENMFMELGFTDFIAEEKIKAIMDEDSYPSVEEEARIRKQAADIAFGGYGPKNPEIFQYEDKFIQSLLDQQINAAGASAFKKITGYAPLSPELLQIPQEAPQMMEPALREKK
jgi:hypothetical protein